MQAPAPNRTPLQAYPHASAGAASAADSCSCSPVATNGNQRLESERRKHERTHARTPHASRHRRTVARNYDPQTILRHLSKC
eukprot:6172557-Pleurochrysis_carterae.AAC.1